MIFYVFVLCKNWIIEVERPDDSHFPGEFKLYAKLGRGLFNVESDTRGQHSRSSAQDSHDDDERKHALLDDAEYIPDLESRQIILKAMDKIGDSFQRVCWTFRFLMLRLREDLFNLYRISKKEAAAW